jgi:hypothetical protein
MDGSRLPKNQPIAEKTMLPVSLLVHLANIGDLENHDALAGGTPGDRHHLIEGFLLRPADENAADIEYKALSRDGDWTEWTPAGGFVGSRGKGIPLQGFAVRVGGDVAAEFDCVCTGNFVGGTDSVQVEGGQECRASDGALLEAIKITFRPKGLTKVESYAPVEDHRIESFAAAEPTPTILADPILPPSNPPDADADPAEAPSAASLSSKKSTGKRSGGWLSFLGF